jgi:hypothetical protein
VCSPNLAPARSGGWLGLFYAPPPFLNATGLSQQEVFKHVALRRPLWVLVVSFASILPYLGHVRFGGGIGSAGWEQDVMLQLPRRDTTSSRQTSRP